MKGFTLFELVIVLAITGIIFTFAHPSYKAYMVKSSRIEAQITLVEMATQMEQWLAANGTYKSAQNTVKSDKYDFSISKVSPTTYTLQATPIGNQGQDDVQCQSLTLNQAGVKGITAGPRGLPVGAIDDCFV